MKIRFSQVNVGETFKWYGANYTKLATIYPTNHKYHKYEMNAARVDNGKQFRLKGNIEVEVDR